MGEKRDVNQLKIQIKESAFIGDCIEAEFQQKFKSYNLELGMQRAHLRHNFIYSIIITYP